jgi:hypothetical protein
MVGIGMKQTNSSEELNHATNHNRKAAAHRFDHRHWCHSGIHDSCRDARLEQWSTVGMERHDDDMSEVYGIDADQVGRHCRAEPNADAEQTYAEVSPIISIAIWSRNRNVQNRTIPPSALGNAVGNDNRPTNRMNGSEENEMSKMAVKFISTTFLVLSLIFYAAELPGSAYQAANAAQTHNDARLAQCVQTTNEREFCKVRVESRQIRVVDLESAECRKARRNVAMYGEALGHLDLANAKHRHAASIYRVTQRSEIEWYKRNC